MLSQNAESVQLVFDTYVEGSVKDSERLRRNSMTTVDIGIIEDETLFPLEIDSFWGSTSNKQKLQLYIHNTIVSDPSKQLS